MSARILVVDDNPLNLKLLTAKLTYEYYAVLTANDGLEALEKAVLEKPDIILLDIMMPHLDGFETCRRLRADPATMHIPIVMVTALSDVADRVKGLEAGADDFLTKPINDLALMARVRSLLRLKMVMDEWRLRESTSSQFMHNADMQEALATITDGHAILLEDDDAERELIVSTLARMPMRVSAAKTVAEAEKLLQDSDCDVVLASLDLREEDGLRICPLLRTREATRQLPILLIANPSEMPRVARGLDVGASDYLMRPIDANELIARTRTQLRQKRHYQLIRNSFERNLELALVDPLTGAFNRRYLEAHMPKLLARLRANRKPFSVLMVDLDHFKKINDTYGHDAGDRILKETASRITQSLRPSDLVVRMGGEEFAVVMPEADVAAALSVAERLRRRIADTPVDDGNDRPVQVTVSIGAASTPQDGTEDWPVLFKRADTALFAAKNEGRNRVIGNKE